MTSDTTESIDTAAGPARVTWHPAKKPRLVLAVGHGAGGGIEARDLRALAAALPAHGVSVALVEQPWRVAGKKTGARAEDAGRRLAGHLARARRAGAAGDLGWPERRCPGRLPHRHRTGAPTPSSLSPSRCTHPASRRVPRRRVARDRRAHPRQYRGQRPVRQAPQEFPEGAYDLIEVPHGDHGFAVPKRAETTREQALELITEGVAKWVGSLG